MTDLTYDTIRTGCFTVIFFCDLHCGAKYGTAQLRYIIDLNPRMTMHLFEARKGHSINILLTPSLTTLNPLNPFTPITF